MLTPIAIVEVGHMLQHVLVTHVHVVLEFVIALPEQASHPVTATSEQEVVAVSAEQVWLNVLAMVDVVVM